MGIVKKTIEGKEYEIINGIFNFDHCSLWYDILDLGDSVFDEKYGQEVYPYKNRYSFN